MIEKILNAKGRTAYAVRPQYISLTHILRQLLAAHYVKMQMLYCLARIVTAVGDNAVSVCESGISRDFRNSFKNLCNNSGVLGTHAVNRRDVLLGDYENMHRCLGRDIVEREHVLVFIRLV